MEQTKKDKIKQTLLETRLKRKTQNCSVFTLKVSSNKLNTMQKECLDMFFIEARWFYNYILSSENIFSFDSKQTNITSKDKNNINIPRQLKYLTAKNRQCILKDMKQSIMSLSAVKKIGKKVGKLKFKSSYNCLDLNQYGTTHKIVDKNKIKINGIKKPLKVKGLHQIKDTYEIANAKLIKKSSGYYIKLTCYEFIKSNMIIKKGKEVGIDFGIKTSITTSDGDKFNIIIEESEQIKKIQRKLAKSVKGSNNNFKLKLKLQKSYEKLNNKKLEEANKIVSFLKKNYDKIYMQDENLKGWHSGLFGKQVQHSCLGTIKRKLLELKNVGIIDKYYPTTKLCIHCGNKIDISLDERIFKCSCGYEEDRDIKAAKTILYVGQCTDYEIPMEHRKYKPVEKLYPTVISNDSSKIASMKQEAQAFRLVGSSLFYYLQSN